MANHTTGAEVDPKELERINKMWCNFTALIKYSTIAIIVVLILMSWFLI